MAISAYVVSKIPVKNKQPIYWNHIRAEFYWLSTCVSINSDGALTLQALMTCVKKAMQLYNQPLSKWIIQKDYQPLLSWPSQTAAGQQTQQVASMLAGHNVNRSASVHVHVNMEIFPEVIGEA